MSISSGIDPSRKRKNRGLGVMMLTGCGLACVLTGSALHAASRNRRRPAQGKPGREAPDRGCPGRAAARASSRTGGSRTARSASSPVAAATASTSPPTGRPRHPPARQAGRRRKGHGKHSPKETAWSVLRMQLLRGEQRGADGGPGAAAREEQLLSRKRPPARSGSPASPITAVSATPASIRAWTWSTVATRASLNMTSSSSRAPRRSRSGSGSPGRSGWK